MTDYLKPKEALPKWTKEQYNLPIIKEPFVREDLIIIPNEEIKPKFTFTPQTVYQITIPSRLRKKIPPRLKELAEIKYYIPRPPSKETINDHIPTWQRLTQTR